MLSAMVPINHYYPSIVIFSCLYIYHVLFHYAWLSKQLDCLAGSIVNAWKVSEIVSGGFYHMLPVYLCVYQDFFLS